MARAESFFLRQLTLWETGKRSWVAGEKWQREASYYLGVQQAFAENVNLLFNFSLQLSMLHLFSVHLPIMGLFVPHLRRHSCLSAETSRRLESRSLQLYG